MTTDGEISLPSEYGERITGSFRLEDGILVVRHHSSGRCKRIPVADTSPFIETLAQLALLELDDAARGSSG